MAMAVSPLFLSRESLSLKNVQRQGKGKEIIDDEGKKFVRKGAMGDKSNATGSRRAKRGRATPPPLPLEKTEGSTQSPRGSTQTFTPAPYGWTERINIGSR
ncbi:Uncharacterized protein Fot_19758 [Forsythia ovata]|uniref:Uncharacterized protein n=1 Tax=Forsythia ovata TaxID=205694 RepID=A0ABD1VM11_9LAMI